MTSALTWGGQRDAESLKAAGTVGVRTAVTAHWDQPAVQWNLSEAKDSPATRYDYYESPAPPSSSDSSWALLVDVADDIFNHKSWRDGAGSREL